MALFFDAEWFDARLSERGLTRADLAAACAMTQEDLTLVFKDQRELSAGEVALIGEILGASPAEVARNAGVATPTPRASGVSLEARIVRLEAQLAAVIARLEALEAGR